MRISPGTPSGPAALWFGVRRRASCSIAGVMHPEIIGMVYRWLGVMWESHGNGAPDERVGSGERAVVSSFSTCLITSFGSVMRLPEMSSLMIERSVGSGGESSLSAAVRMMDCRATFGFLTNMRRRAFPYFSRRCCGRVLGVGRWSFGVL